MKQDIKDAFDKYAKEGKLCGGFCAAVLANDFQAAIGKVDDENILDLREIAAYIHWEIPAICHGSYEIVDAWIAKKAEERGAT